MKRGGGWVGPFEDERGICTQFLKRLLRRLDKNTCLLVPFLAPKQPLLVVYIEKALCTIL